MTKWWFCLLAIACLAPSSAAAQAPLAEQVAGALAAAGPGARWGVLVLDPDGRELVAIRPDERFIPASTTKLFTTAAAYATLTALDQPDAAGGASVAIGKRDVTLIGRGDARLSSAPDCVKNCLAALADAVRAAKRRVRDVIGDARLFADERWSPGMSWNNIPTRSGTGVAALSLDDNEVALTVTPGPSAGAAAVITGPGYFAVDSRVATVAADAPSELSYHRLPAERRVRVTGTVALGAPQVLRLGVDDPAHYAAWRFADLLRARGVKVRGQVRSRYRDPDAPGEPVVDSARLIPPPLADDIAVITTQSQNLHAELLLRRVGLAYGEGSIAAGRRAVEATVAAAGVQRWAYDFADGSGMSTYNRVTPRATVTLLRWAAGQPWGARWRAGLATPGAGTLRSRFGGTSLAGRLWAKTGSLNATNALAGYLQAKSGRVLMFAVYANDVPDGAGATAAMDRALLMVAEGS